MIPIYEPWITDREKKYAKEAIDTGWISSLGPFTTKFEKAFAEYLGVRHAISTNTGTAACHLALATLGIGPGDEVIVPSLTYIATANVVEYCGATPVSVDVDIDTWNIDPSLVEQAITARTKAVFPVHLFGNPARMLELQDICKEHRLYLIEDACEALGAECQLGKAGSVSDIGCFSFYGNKTITAGEGGMVVTNSDTWAEHCRMLRGQGQTKTYFHPYVGFNYRMTNIASAIALAQIERIDNILENKEGIYESYVAKFKDCPAVRTQVVDEGSTHGYWMMTVMVDNKPAVTKALASNEIDYRPVFYPLCDLPPYRSHRNAPIARQIHHHGIMLPSYPALGGNNLWDIADLVIGHAE